MVERLKTVWVKRRSLVLFSGLIVLVGAGWGAARFVRTGPSVPTAEVKRGEFVDHVQVRGEVKALRSVILTAPSNTGSSDIQIIKLVKNGAMVKKGDVVVQFDVATLQRTLDEKRSEMKQAEGEIEQTRAQGRLREEQDRTDLVKAQYDVERAKLEVSKQEIVSEIEAEEAKAKLADAVQQLREAEQKQKADHDGNAADVEAKAQKRDKALYEVQQAERRIAALTLRAPVGGLVTLMPNDRAGGFITENAPEFKEGDRAWPGAAIAEIPDLETLRVTALIDETDRGRLQVGQSASIRVDAVPDREFPARVVEISTLAKLDFSSWPAKKNFDMTFRLVQADRRLRPGMSATARVAVERLTDSILVPAGAVFQKQGRTVAYVLRGSTFEERGIQLARRNADQVAVAQGLEAGERVALKDPTEKNEMESGGS